MLAVIGTTLATLMEMARRERGQSLAEYALILGLVVVGAITVLGVLGTNIVEKLNQVAGAL